MIGMKEVVIAEGSPREIANVIRNYDPELMSVLLRDISECLSKDSHSTEISRFIGRMRSPYAGMKRVKVRIVTDQELRNMEDLRLCSNWRRFAGESLRLSE